MTEVVKPTVHQAMTTVSLIMQAGQKLLAVTAQGHEAPLPADPGLAQVDAADGDLLEVTELLAEAQIACLRWLEGPTDEDSQLAAALARWLP